MYKTFIILFCLIINTLYSFAESRAIVTRQPIYNHYNNQTHPQYQYFENQQQNYPNHQFYRPMYQQNQNYFSDINALEKYSFNKNFPRENTIQRIQRLEMQAFGAIQEGDITTRYENVKSAILARPKENYKTSLIRNLGNYFGGQITGFTPSFTGFNSDPFYSTNSNFSTTQFPSTYGNTSGIQYNSPWGSGYKINNFGTGNSSGIRILD